MIIYSGWGILVPMFGALGFVVAALCVPGLRSVGVVNMDWIAASAAIAGGLTAGVPCWAFGRRVNHPSKARQLIDKQTGKPVTLWPRNHLMFIPMQYYGVLYVLGSILIAAACIFSSTDRPTDPPQMETR